MSKETGITPAMLRAVLEGRGIEAGTPAGIVESEKQGQQQVLGGGLMPRTIFY